MQNWNHQENSEMGAILQDLLEEVFEKGHYLETAHREYFSQSTGDAHPSVRNEIFLTAKSLIRHWRLLCFLAELPDELDAGFTRKLLPIHHDLQTHLPLEIDKPELWPKRWQAKLEAASKSPARFFSVSDFLFTQLQESLGDQTNQVLRVLNTPASPDIRINQLKSNRQSLTAALESEGYEILEQLPHGMQLAGERNLFQTQAFKDGCFEIQDRSSQQVAPFMQLKSRGRILDACAGAGGKALHLAEFMQNRGKLIAMDIYPQKLEELSTRAKRAGAHCIETRLKTSTKAVKRLKDTIDAVLLDVPCSGSGTLRQHPEIKYSFKETNLKNLTATQAELLVRHAPVVRSGGSIVYTTCSLLKQENDAQIDAFLQQHPEFGFVEEERKTIFPEDNGGHGFFMCRLRKA